MATVCRACSLLAHAHSTLLGQVADGVEGHVQGLAQGARVLRQRRRIGQRVQRRLTKIDEAFAVMRHITAWSVTDIQRLVAEELAGKEHDRADHDDERVIASFSERCELENAEGYSGEDGTTVDEDSRAEHDGQENSGMHEGYHLEDYCQDCTTQELSSGGARGSCCDESAATACESGVHSRVASGAVARVVAHFESLSLQGYQKNDKGGPQRPQEAKEGEEAYCPMDSNSTADPAEEIGRPAQFESCSPDAHAQAGLPCPMGCVRQDARADVAVSDVGNQEEGGGPRCPATAPAQGGFEPAGGAAAGSGRSAGDGDINGAEHDHDGDTDGDCDGDYDGNYDGDDKCEYEGPNRLGSDDREDLAGGAACSAAIGGEDSGGVGGGVSSGADDDGYNDDYGGDDKCGYEGIDARSVDHEGFEGENDVRDVAGGVDGVAEQAQARPAACGGRHMTGHAGVQTDVSMGSHIMVECLSDQIGGMGCGMGGMRGGCCYVDGATSSDDEDPGSDGEHSSSSQRDNSSDCHGLEEMASAGAQVQSDSECESVALGAELEEGLHRMTEQIRAGIPELVEAIMRDLPPPPAELLRRRP